MEQIGPFDARGPLAPAAVGTEIIPLRALAGAALGRQGKGAGGRGVAGHAGGADHLPDDAAAGMVAAAVDGDDLIGDVHLDIVGSRRLGGLPEYQSGRCRERQDKQHSEQSLQFH